MAERFKFSEFSKVKELFSRYFKRSVGPFYDPILSFAMGGITIDIEAFDREMHSIHGNYEDSGFSLQELITNKYGPEAKDFLEQII